MDSTYSSSAKIDVTTEDAQLEHVLERTNQMLVNAEVDNYATKIFLKNMSHKVRTSMNGILGFVDLIFHSELTGKQHRYLELVKNSAYELLIYLDDHIDLSQIEIEQYKTSSVTFNLITLLETVVDLLYQQLHEKSIQLHLHVEKNVPAYVMGDAERLIRTFINLLSKSHDGSTLNDVVINVSVADCSSKYITLAFWIYNSDGKMLIAPELNSYTAVESPMGNRVHPGHNLGLAIASYFIQSQNGSLYGRRQENYGTNFYFTIKLPLATNESQLSGNPKTPISEKNILIVADNSINSAIIEKSFSAQAKQITIANENDNISNLLDTKEVDLIIIDISRSSQFASTVFSEILKRSYLIPKTVVLIDRDTPYFKSFPEFEQLNTIFKPCKCHQVSNAISRVTDDNYNYSIQKQTYSNYNQKRILLVEDILVNQILAKTLLKDTGILIDVAEDGEKALQALENNEYDLVLMDVQMPLMDGITATKIIRNEMNLKDIPIIAMTAQIMTEDKEMCMDAGMNDYISKPIRNDELHEILQKWLKK
ncbi:response regulator [candidate division KSB1 bacterium]|nr:response regulator [candidate division KSB1 bacterium]